MIVNINTAKFLFEFQSKLVLQKRFSFTFQKTEYLKAHGTAALSSACDRWLLKKFPVLY
jgi:hypothetical protein